MELVLSNHWNGDGDVTWWMCMYEYDISVHNRKIIGKAVQAVNESRIQMNNCHALSFQQTYTKKKTKTDEKLLPDSRPFDSPSSYNAWSLYSIHWMIFECEMFHSWIISHLHVVIAWVCVQCGRGKWPIRSDTKKIIIIICYLLWNRMALNGKSIVVTEKKTNTETRKKERHDSHSNNVPVIA